MPRSLIVVALRCLGCILVAATVYWTWQTHRTDLPILLVAMAVGGLTGLVATIRKRRQRGEPRVADD